MFLYPSVLFWSHHLLHVTVVIDTGSCIFLVLELFEVPSAEKVWASIDEHKRCSGLGILFLLVHEHPSFIQSIGIIRAFCLPEGTSVPGAQKKLLGCGLLGGDQYSGWHYVMSILQYKNEYLIRYDSLRHADNRKYFSGLSLTRNRRELAREVGKIWRCYCWEKGNFIMITEFKCGQTWKMWPSPHSLSLYSTFKKEESKLYKYRD